MSAIIRRSDQGRALRALVKALEPMLADLEEQRGSIAKVAAHSPRAHFSIAEATYSRTRNLIDAWLAAKDAVNIMDGK